MSPRPALPQRHENAHLATLGPGTLPPVKYQVLDRDGHEVLVGRMKIPTPSGHAFILRRFDTGAISLTTMFRAAFPTASELDEKKETNWVKETYNLAGNNGSAKEPAIVRLAGTWVSPDVALLPEIAGVYKLDSVLPEVANAVPDPAAIYRKSTKASPAKPTAAAGGRTASPVQSPSPLPTPAPSITLPTPKRRREASPAPAAAAAEQSVLPPPRRSTRTKSPAPAPLPLPVRSPTKAAAAASTPTRPAKTVRSSVRRTEVSTPGGSDETVVEVEEEEETVEMSARPNMAEDVSEQRALIERLKAEREQARGEAEAAVDAEAEVDAVAKRAREEVEGEEGEGAGLRFYFKEPENEERQIATNRRVGRFALEPKQKSFAWGVAAFAIGMGAVSYLPNFF